MGVSIAVGLRRVELGQAGVSSSGVRADRDGVVAVGSESLSLRRVSVGLGDLVDPSLFGLERGVVDGGLFDLRVCALSASAFTVCTRDVKAVQL